MMKKIFSFIRNMILFVILFGLVSAGIDYLKMSGGDIPIFNVKEFNSKTKIQTFKGLFYTAKRKIRASLNEPLTDSSRLKFKLLFFDLKITRQFREESFEFNIETTPSEECVASKLYYADLDIKVYTYCIDELTIKDSVNGDKKTLFEYLKNDKSIINDIVDKLAFTGIASDNTTQMFTTTDNLLVKNGLSMFICDAANVNDVYFTSYGTEMQKDFCTYKDDDFKFIYEIYEEKEDVDNTETNPNGQEIQVQPETFFEDEEYYYQFDKPKLNKLFIITPSVRGKAETKTPLSYFLQRGYLTMNELEEKGLIFNKVKKSQ